MPPELGGKVRAGHRRRARRADRPRRRARARRARAHGLCSRTSTREALAERVQEFATAAASTAVARRVISPTRAPRARPRGCAEAQFGGLDIVVNVAGGLFSYGPFDGPRPRRRSTASSPSTSSTDVLRVPGGDSLAAAARRRGDRQFRVHRRAPARRSRWPPYSAAKSAVAGLTRALARELRDDGIRVNAVAPAAGAHRRQPAAHGRRTPGSWRSPTSCSTVLWLERRSAHGDRTDPAARRASPRIADRAAHGPAGARHRSRPPRGQAIAVGLAQAGCDVAVHYHGSADGRRGDGREPCARPGGRAELFQADLRDAAAARALPDQAARVVRPARHPGQLRGHHGAARIRGVTPEDWDDALDLNLPAAFFLSQGAAPHLRRTAGKIVNLADLAGLRALARVCAAQRQQGGRRHAHPGARARARARHHRERRRTRRRAPARRLGCSTRETISPRPRPLKRLGAPEDVVRGGAVPARERLRDRDRAAVDGGRLMR